MVGEEKLQPRLCTVRKWPDFAGYGFNLHAERGRAGQFIGKVDEGSPAQAAGMKEGDRIVEVNGTNIGNENHGQVVTRIKASGDHVTMLLVDAETDKHYKDQKVVISSDLDEVIRMETPPRSGQQDIPETPEDEINEEPEETQPDHEDSDPEDTVNNVEKEPEPEPEDDNALSGQYDTEIIAAENSEMAENSELAEIDNDTPPPPPDAEPPAYVDDREPSPEPEREPSPEPEREPSPDLQVPSHNYYPRLCYIKKWPDFQGYGFNLHAEKDKQGQYIGAVDDNSPAEDADLRSGDRIIEVNGVNIEDETHQQVIARIKAGGDETKMLVVDHETDEFYKNNGIRIHSSMAEVKFKETSQRDAKEMTYHPRQCHLVKWPDFNGYGFNLHAEKERGAQYIGKIDPGSPAEDAGLKENDRIIAVNGVNIEEETHQQVIGRIKAGGDETKLLVVDKAADQYYKSKGITVTTAMPEVKFLQAARRSPKPGAPAVANGDTSSSPASQPTRVEVAKEPSAQANGGDFLNMSAKQMRELLAQKKKVDPKQKSDLSFKTKYELFQKM